MGSVALVLTLEARLTRGRRRPGPARGSSDLLDLAAAGDLPRDPDQHRRRGRRARWWPRTGGSWRPRRTSRAGRRSPAFDPGRRPRRPHRRRPGRRRDRDLPAVGRHRRRAPTARSRSTSAPAWSPSTRRPPRCAGRCCWAYPSSCCCWRSGTWLVLGGALRRVDRIRTEVDAITEERLDRRVPGHRRRRRGRAAGRHDEPDARRLEALGAPAARLRRRRLPRPAEPAGRPAGAARGGAGPPRVDRGRPRSAADLLATTARDGAPGRRPARPRRRRRGRRRHPTAAASTSRTWCSRRPPGPGPARRVRLRHQPVSAAPVRANRGEVQRIVRNLLDNALAHADSVVELRVSSGGRPRPGSTSSTTARRPGRGAGADLRALPPRRTQHRSAAHAPAAAWGWPSPGASPSAPAAPGTGRRTRHARRALRAAAAGTGG